MATKPDRKYEALKRAAEALVIDWDTVIVLTSKYDITMDRTIPGQWTLGNGFAIEAQVEQWLDQVKRDREDGFECPGCPNCSEDCGPSIEVDPTEFNGPDGDGDEDDEAVGNR